MSAHNFTVGARANRVQRPLSMDELHQMVPSAFAQRPHESRSQRYAFIPTLAVIEGLQKAGFLPYSATQSIVRDASKRDFTKHMIRFRHQDYAGNAVGDVFPEVALINSHDGSSRYKLLEALFRLACSNGLIVAAGSENEISVQHTGNIVAEVVEASNVLTGNAQKALGAATKWGQLLLTDGEQKVLAEAAHDLRFADAEGKVTTPITPAQLLEPRRYDDQGKDLWRTFNVIQENVIKGGLHGFQQNEGRLGRAVTTRQVRGIDQNVKLNRALWKLAEGMAKLKGGDPLPQVIEPEYVQ